MDGLIKRFPGLTGNQLKLIALLAMTIDHIGLVLFPSAGILRIIGRLAFPIFAYLIAEGCTHTHSRKKYLGTMVLFSAACQGVYFLFMHSLYQCVLVTFSLSISLIFLLDSAVHRPTKWAWLSAAGGFAVVLVLTVLLPQLLSWTDYSVDYGFWGVMLPVFVYFGRGRFRKLLLFTVGLCLMNFFFEGIQWFSMAVIPLVALYNGRRGKWNLKHLFYFYYPVHLVVIQILSWLLG